MYCNNMRSATDASLQTLPWLEVPNGLVTVSTYFMPTRSLHIRMITRTRSWLSRRSESVLSFYVGFLLHVEPLAAKMIIFGDLH